MENANKKKEKNLPEETLGGSNSFEKTPSATLDSNFKKLKIELEEVKILNEKYLDGWKRTKSDALNEKNSFLKSKIELERVYIKSFIEKFLPVLDSVYLALANSDKVGVECNKGLELIYKQFQQSLNSLNIDILEPLNEDFDPNLHETIGYFDTDDRKMDGKITSIVKLGIKFQDFLIRVPVVYVGNYKSAK